MNHHDTRCINTHVAPPLPCQLHVPTPCVQPDPITAFTFPIYMNITPILSMVSSHERTITSTRPSPSDSFTDRQGASHTPTRSGVLNESSLAAKATTVAGRPGRPRTGDSNRRSWKIGDDGSKTRSGVSRSLYGVRRCDGEGRRTLSIKVVGAAINTQERDHDHVEISTGYPTNSTRSRTNEEQRSWGLTRSLSPVEIRGCERKESCEREGG